MTGGPIQRKTKLFGFNIIRFDFARWHEFEHANWDALDANLAQLGLISNAGPWDNNTTYLVGDRVVDTDVNAIYTALVGNTSPATGTFADYRTANPTHWRVVSSVPNFRGDHTIGVAYYAGDIARVGNVYKLALIAHDSDGSTWANGAYWTTVFDPTSTVTEIIGYRDTTLQYRNDASGYASAALTYRNDALQYRSDASTYAGQASTSAGAASSSAGAAQTARTGAETARTGAETARDLTLGYRDAALSYRDTASNHKDAAQTARFAAEAALDSFDDRYLGPKATDPTLDNDGFTIAVGALYWNLTNNIMRVRNSSGAWVDATANTNIYRWRTIATNPVSVLTGADNYSMNLNYTAGLELVYVNGTLLQWPSDYTRTNATTITLAKTLNTGDAVEVVIFTPFTVVDVYTKTDADAKFTEISENVGHAGVQLYRIDGSTIGVRLVNGGRIIINGVSRKATARTLAVGLVTVDTPVYIYAYWNGTAVAYELFTIGHTTHTDGVEIKSGDPSRTLVGMMFRSSVFGFRDEVTYRFLANWFNRVKKVGQVVANGAVVAASTTTQTAVTTIYGLMWAGDEATSVVTGIVYPPTAGTLAIVGMFWNGSPVGIEAHDYNSIAGAYHSYAVKAGPLVPSGDGLQNFQITGRTSGGGNWNLTGVLTVELFI